MHRRIDSRSRNDSTQTKVLLQDCIPQDEKVRLTSRGHHMAMEELLEMIPQLLAHLWLRHQIEQETQKSWMLLFDLEALELWIHSFLSSNAVLVMFGCYCRRARRDGGWGRVVTSYYGNGLFYGVFSSPSWEWTDETVRRWDVTTKDQITQKQVHLLVNFNEKHGHISIWFCFTIHGGCITDMVSERSSSRPPDHQEFSSKWLISSYLAAFEYMELQKVSLNTA